jgi:hypothetical protein
MKKKYGHLLKISHKTGKIESIRRRWPPLPEKKDRKQYQAEYYAKNRAKLAEQKKEARLAKQEEENAARRER